MALDDIFFILLASLALSVSQRDAPLDVAIRQLRDPKEDIRATALLGITDRGKAAASAAAPAVIDMMRTYGWRGRDFDYGCDVLAAAPERALVALPLLAHYSVEALEDRNNPVVTFCVQGIMEHVGVEKMPEVIRATVPEARRWWRDSHHGPSTAEKTNMARVVFAQAVRRWGASVIPYVERGLRDSDPYVRAEAAAVFYDLEDNAATLLPILKAALIRERSAWPRYQIQFAIDYLESREKKR
ncbi:MAG: hypothetical protein EHM89_12750 [Acidobacteria bacterium]|nr:MAG: hypothetical protein EHM89_12750 [Acidobacteriota bacterium]